MRGVYPKLKALKGLLENLHEAADPVFKYGHLINLGNNIREYKGASKALEEFNEFLASLDDARPSGSPTQKSPINPREADIDRGREASRSLFDALIHLQTGCGIPHTARLHLTGFKRKDRGSFRPAYDMFVSCCQESAGWHESHCLISEMTLRPSQQVQYGVRMGLGAPLPARADSIAWLRGRLIVEDRPLAEVVKELNRYHHGHIALLDPDLQSLLVNGVIPITDRAASVDALEQSLGLKATWLTSYWVFLSK